MIRPLSLPAATSRADAPVLARATLTSAEAAEPLRIEVMLKMRHFDELEKRVQAGELIPRAEMEERFLPLASDHVAVSAWLTAQGLTVEASGAGHAAVIATGSATQLQSAFATTFARVSRRGTEFTAAVSAPALPPEIESRVASVHGLQPFMRPHKNLIRKADYVAPSAPSRYIEPPFLVSDILTAYNAQASGLTGAGQQIGIVIDTVPLNSDLTQFWTANNLSQSLDNITTVNVTGKNITGETGEETLDVSWSSGLASGAQVIIYACGDLSYANDCYSRILDDLQGNERPNLHQISMSYGGGEVEDETPSDMSSVHQLFTAITAYGVSLFAASGDEGAYSDGDKTLEVLYPASDPVVTGVGGTSLYLNSSSGAIEAETAWANLGAKYGGASGGGVSGYFSRPSCQKGSTVPSGTMRLVPDVSLAADPDTGCYLVLKGKVQQYGGTSWSSPCWAALCALINQARAAASLSPLAGANPALYPLIGQADFHDITSGDNGYYQAGTGFDLVTGLGTVNFGTLVGDLAYVPVAPVINSSLTAAAMSSSAFTYQITASNSPTSFSASNLPSGLAINMTTGVISGTAPANTGSATTYNISIAATNGTGTDHKMLVLTVNSASAVTVTATVTVSQTELGSGAPGEITLSIPDALTTDLVVSYTLAGSAINGTDYATLSGHAKIKAGKTSKAIQIVPTGTLEGAAKKLVKLTLASGGSYAVGTTGEVKVHILAQ